MIWLFAEEILQIWLGADFVSESTASLQILALGVLINSLSYAPFALLQGLGRPDLPAKFHMIELPAYIIVVWILISNFGISGAAGAWTLRVALDALLLFWAALKVSNLSLNVMENNGAILAGASLVILAGVGYVMKTVTGDLSLYAQSFLVLGLLIPFAWMVWSRVFDGSDRRVVLNIIKAQEIAGSTQ